MNKLTRKNQILLGSVSIAAMSLYSLRKYMDGGKCKIVKDLKGKVAVVTGGNSGIGKETAKGLAKMGCHVIIGARDLERNEQTVAQIQNEFPQSSVSAYSLDLADKISIQQFVSNIEKDLTEREKQMTIHFLVNNAGVVTLPQMKRTNYDVEMQIGINHFGHFYLTSLLWDKLASCGNPRIINLSSIAHKDHDIDFEDINFEVKKYEPYVAYARSKLASLIFASELQRRMDQAGINGISISLHPGVVRTNSARYFFDSPIKKLFLAMTLPFQLLLMKSSVQGAQTSLYGCLADDIEKGQYYADCKVSPIGSNQGKDPQAGRKLWQKSEEFMHVKFNL